jgi:hypothetical protein
MEVLSKDGWLGGWFTESSGYKYTKASRYLSKLQHLKNKTSITPQNPLRRIDLTKKTNQAKLHQPNPVSTIHVRVHAARDREHGCNNSFTFCRGCTHSPWVAITLIAGYLLYRRVPLHTSKVGARTSLQGCSMVFPSLQCTHWGPLLRRVDLRRVHSLTHSFPTRRILRESTQSAPPIGTPN